MYSFMEYFEYVKGLSELEYNINSVKNIFQAIGVILGGEKSQYYLAIPEKEEEKELP